MISNFSRNVLWCSERMELVQELISAWSDSLAEVPLGRKARSTGVRSCLSNHSSLSGAAAAQRTFLSSLFEPVTLRLTSLEHVAQIAANASGYPAKQRGLRIQFAQDPLSPDYSHVSIRNEMFCSFFISTQAGWGAASKERAPSNGTPVRSNLIHLIQQAP